MSPHEVGERQRLILWISAVAVAITLGFSIFFYVVRVIWALGDVPVGGQVGLR
jgi:hypothetical protein